MTFEHYGNLAVVTTTVALLLHGCVQVPVKIRAELEFLLLLEELVDDVPDATLKVLPFPSINTDQQQDTLDNRSL